MERGGKMCKPSWSDPSCPPWANYLAQDNDGVWFWYATKPIARTSVWLSKEECCTAFVNNPNWRNTLEERPVHKSSFDYEAEGKSNEV